MKRLAIIGLILFVGCTHMAAERDLNRTAHRVSRMESRELRETDTEVLLRAYKWHPEAREAIKVELARRNIIDFSSWSPIERHKIHIGMTKEAVRLSWGDPSRINRTVGRWGIHEQWVYGRYPHAEYLYFENNQLVGWQN